MEKDENKRDTSERDFGLMNITIGILFVTIAIFIGYVVVDYIKFALEHWFSTNLSHGMNRLLVKYSQITARNILHIR